MSRMLHFAPVRCDAAALIHYVNLFGVCFPDTGKFTATYLNWLYRDNPDGQAIGFDAWDGMTLAAHYVVLPGRATVGGSTVSVALSLNTATHPRYQGQQLFTRLAEMTYAAAHSQHISAIYGVANARSTPGFLRKLGFQLVEPLVAQVGIGSVRRTGALPRFSAQFERIWSPASLAWRCANPQNRVYCRRRDSTTEFFAAALQRRIPVFAELPAQDCPGPHHPASPWTLPMRLFIGLVPTPLATGRGYLAIPQRFKPSPLNFIYRSLDQRVETLDAGAISFSFLDFDAY